MTKRDFLLCAEGRSLNGAGKQAMTKIFRRLLAFAVLLPLLATAPARAQLYNAGDPCPEPTPGRIVTQEGAAGPSLVCNGTTLEVDESIKTGPYARGIGTANPKAPLHVAGEAIIGPTTGLACDADRTGGIRWSAANSTIEMCDGVTWRKIAASNAGTDFTPDAFSFTDVTNQPLGQLILSNTLTITGMDAGTVVSVSGAGSPMVSINGGAWVTAGTIDPGQTLQVRLTSDTSVSTARVAAVTVGTVTDNWSVTTKAGNTRIFRTPSNYNGNLGGIGGAHTLCQSAAAGLGYGGIWRALLSNEFLDARDMLTIAYPVVRASDAVTVQATNLWAGSLTNEVNPGANQDVWTGTEADGTRTSGSTCSSWRATTGNSQPGRANISSSYWVKYTISPVCSNTNFLYCIEQAAPIGAILGITPGSSSTMFVYGPGAPAYGTAQTFTVENAGDTTSATMATSLSNTTNFEFTSDSCNGNTLAQGATCTVSIRPKANLPANKGPISTNFTVTANNNPSIALSGKAMDCTTPTTGDEGAVCADGTVYAGLSGASTPMYVTRCDAGMTWDGSACTGTRGTYYWNNGNGTGFVDTSLSNTGFSDGQGYTAVLITEDSDSVTGGVQPHQAAQYCADLVMHGHSDWYLPAKNELNTMYGNKTAIGNFDTGGTSYWSSSENLSGLAWLQRFSDGNQNSSGKNNVYDVRCARR